MLFTSRGELNCSSSAERRHLGLELAGLMARLAAAIETLARLIPQGLIQRWERPGHGLNARQRAGARATLRFRSNSNLEGPGSSA